ncbi:MAG: PP2C family protein-serine/threonine phosphatase [Thermoanaerobaculales bacterium]|jgi:sigma-B regulation protein RsbU (phosphoserine phosphatase)|nr:PP2C family protein-serine/threonine phosphatase [Thermoanaerobaculales bacterium]
MPRRSISLFKRIERALETIASGSSPLETIQRTAGFIADSFADDLGIRGGRIYAQDDGSYELVETFGDASREPIGLRVWRTYPPFDQILDVGSVVMRRDDPRLDQRLEADLGTREWFAAVAVADAGYVLSFDVESATLDIENVVATLNIIRLAINQKLRDDRMRAIMEDVRQIQNSILPRHLPQPGDYSIAARAVAAEVVGGDFYDVITLDEGVFDVAVADATGHGLPAALQVRDVFTGLRMGLAREFKLTRTVQRLNGIIHRSRLATKFVSLFLAEIDLSGTLIYCNAGHPAALLLRADGSALRLNPTGMILGPSAEASYGIGLETINPGDLLAIFTDGITEVTGAGAVAEEYGTERLVHVLRVARHLDPIAIVDRVFADVEAFSSTSPPADDQTLVVVKRMASRMEEVPA